MDFTDGGQGDQLSGLPLLASEWGFSCYKNAQGDWQIQPQINEQKINDQNWCLQEYHERWLLVINGVPQVLFQTAEATDFVRRRLPI